MRYATKAVAVLACLLAGVSGAKADPATPANPAPAESRNGGDQIPPFLPDYFSKAFEIDGKRIKLASHAEKDKTSHYSYATDDQVIDLNVESIQCDAASCAVIYNNALQYFNKQITQNAGQFRLATNTEFRAEWHTGLGDNFLFAFGLPKSLILWSYTVRLARPFDGNKYFGTIEPLIDQLRYEQALTDGNIELSHWDKQIRSYERQLLKDGRKDDALEVLKNLIHTSPFDYEAHVDYMQNASDPVAAKASATTVLNNAEDPDLIAKAAKFLGQEQPDIASLPPLARGERGLQLILIPLPPCSVSLIREAGVIYQKITDIPVKIERLPDDSWKFREPERLFGQKTMQQMIIDHEGPNVDFKGWNFERYKSAVFKSIESADALTKFMTSQFIDDAGKEPGQYRAWYYLQHLSTIVAQYRPDDLRTMYVGVTEANIYDGDTNFVFSEGIRRQYLLTSILSYAVFENKTLRGPYESRPRLAERIAKELVPASLPALKIPRPDDPSDPYSYSNGADRTDQKTLVLSPPVRAALDKFR